MAFVRTKSLNENQLGDSIVSSVSAEQKEDEVVKSRFKDDNINKIAVTDKEALEEYFYFKSNIPYVILHTRRRFWLTQFIIIILAFTMTSLCAAFSNGIDVDGQEIFLFSPTRQNELIFAVLWAGFYDSQQDNSIFYDTYPYYIMLLLFLIERYC